MHFAPGLKSRGREGKKEAIAFGEGLAGKLVFL
jgi:hypothetical protein